MSALEQDQAAMMQALDHGPDHLPNALFAGSQARVFAGMKVHANTISHARLVALEESFPRTLDHLGFEQFNQLSREYLEQPGVTAHPLAKIGIGFSAFLADNRESTSAADLARFEWAWLGSYHAADARSLRLADLAGLAPDALMGFTVKAHPAASIDRYDIGVLRLIGEEGPGLAEADAILLVRPNVEVLVYSASAAMLAMLPPPNQTTRVGNLLADASEPAGKDQAAIDESMSALIALLDAGALTATVI